MTVEAAVSEADVSKLTLGMEVYFTTLGSGERRWTGKLQQILPTPVTENNIVLYTALFGAENADGALLMNMTAQVFFVTESAYGVLSVPVGALSYPTAVASTSATALSGPASEHTPLPTVSRRPPAQPSTAQPTIAQFTQNSGQPGRAAIVRVVENNKTIVERTIKVGVTSRISAEVLSGLRAGEEVVAGIIDTPSRNE